MKVCAAFGFDQESILVFALCDHFNLSRAGPACRDDKETVVERRSRSRYLAVIKSAGAFGNHGRRLSNPLAAVWRSCITHLMYDVGCKLIR